MTARWYICPYDVEVKGNGRERDMVRFPSMIRHIPAVPNASGFTWSMVEIKNSNLLVKVNASDVMLTTIEADADFTRLDGREAQTRARLLSIGYTQANLNSVDPWTERNLWTMLTTEGRSNLRDNAARNGVNILTGRRNLSRSIDSIDDEIR